MSCTACICSGLSFLRTHTKLRPSVNRASRSLASRSGKICASSLATRVGSTMSLGWAYSEWVSRLVARMRPFRSVRSARPVRICAPELALRGSDGSVAASRPMRPPMTVKAMVKAIPSSRRRPSARARARSRVFSCRRRIFSRSMLSGFSPRARADRMRARGLRGVRIMAPAPHANRQFRPGRRCPVFRSGRWCRSHPSAHS